MTLKELRQLRDLIHEIRHDEERLAEIRDRSGNRAPSATVPQRHISDAVADKIERMSELEAVIAEKQARCVQEKIRLERFIAEIPDSFTRRIFTLRFSEAMSWVEVAHKIGGGNTADGVRMVVDRYLRKM